MAEQPEFSSQAEGFSRPLLILASASPRRLALLQQVGIEATVAPVSIDESAMPGESAVALVQRLARSKAERCAEGLQQTDKPEQTRVILAADTVVELGQEILGKPRDRSDALAMLSRLSGRVHSVHTSVCVQGIPNFSDQNSPAPPMQCIVTTRVKMDKINDATAQWYWDSGEPADKAGSYAIQGLGARFVAHLSGSYSNVVGLPLFETMALLKSAGICNA